MPVVNPVEKSVAVKVLAQPETPVEILPGDAGIKIGDHRSFWRRIFDSWVQRIQAVAGILCALWLAIPQDAITAVIPSKYAAGGLLAYAIITAIARMRTL